MGDGGNLTITGQDGSSQLSVSDGEALTEVATKINNVSHETGVIAEVSGNTLTFRSVDYGSEASVAVTARLGILGHRRLRRQRGLRHPT